MQRGLVFSMKNNAAARLEGNIYMLSVTASINIPLSS
jgi:hypothetical protein